MNEKELKEYEEKVKKYKSALNYVYTDGTVSGAERTSLENLKNELGLTTDECRNFEQPYVLAKKAEEEGKQLHFEDICDCHHMYLCHIDDSLRWESIDGSGVENIEIGDTYIEKCSAGGFGTHDAFITIGESVEDLLSKYGENNFPEQAVKDGKVILFNRSEFGTVENIDKYLMARFNILTPIEIEEQYAEGLGEHGEVLKDYIRQTNKKEFYDVFLNENDLRKTGTFLRAMITVKGDIDLYAFKPPFKMKNQDIQLVEWDEKDIPVIAELDTENGFRNLLRELYEYYKDNKEWETEVEYLSVLLDAYEKGINEDRYLEAKWDELENVPFITDENGNEILDAEEGWRHFNKGTSKEQILKYFDFNHSKGVAYLVNDYPADKAIKEYIEKNFTEDAANYIQSHVVSKLLDEGREITEMSLKEIAEKAMNELDEYFNAIDSKEQLEEAKHYYDYIYKELSDTAREGVNRQVLDRQDRNEEENINSHFNKEHKTMENKVKKEEISQNANSKIATNFILEKLQNAGIEIVTDKEEFNRILESENVLQKMIENNEAPEKIEHQKQYINGLIVNQDELNLLEDNIANAFKQLDKSLRFNANFEVQSEKLKEEVSIFPGSTGKHGLGIRHIIEERAKKDNLSLDEITALSSLIIDTVQTGDITRDSENRCEFSKKGIIAIVRKDFDDTHQNWILTGFHYKGEIEEKNREATETIQTVIAKYSQSQDYSYFRNQVGAVIASLDLNISQTVNKSSKNHQEKLEIKYETKANDGTYFVTSMETQKVQNEKPIVIDNPSKAIPLLEKFANDEVENFGVILLNTHHQVKEVRVISVGTINSTLVHVRETFKEAIRHSSAGIILFHNHPGGNPLPSFEDLKTTKKLLETSQTIGIPILDHIIVTPFDGYYSFLEQNKLQELQGEINKPNYFIQNNQTFGFTHNGKIYLNPDIMNSNAAVHEYTHLWDKYTQNTNPELWQKGKDILSKTHLWQEVKVDPNYQDISDDDDLVLSEVHSRICGELAQKVLERIAEQDGEITKDKVIDWDKETWDFIFTSIGIETFNSVNPELKLSKEDLKDLLSQPMKDLMEGKNINMQKSMSFEYMEKVFDEEYSKAKIRELNNGTAVLRPINRLLKENGKVEFTKSDWIRRDDRLKDSIGEHTVLASLTSIMLSNNIPVETLKPAEWNNFNKIKESTDRYLSKKEMQITSENNMENTNLIKENISDDQIFEWIKDAHYKTDNWDFDVVSSKNDVANLSAIHLIKDLAKEDLSKYEDATSLSEFIDRKMKENNMLIMPEDNVNYSEDIEPISDFARELWNNNLLQKYVKNYAASISTLSQNRNLMAINEAKELIEKFVFDEYMSTPDFDNLHEIGIAYTEYTDPLTKSDYSVQVNVNLIEPSIVKIVNGIEVSKDEYESLKDLNTLALSDLDFDELVDISNGEDEIGLRKKHEEIESQLLSQANKIFEEKFNSSALVTKAKLYNPLDYGFEKDNKLHILLEVNSNEREDDLFNVLAKEEYKLSNGVEVDFNPITIREYGSIDQYLDSLQKEYKKELQIKHEKEILDSLKTDFIPSALNLDSTYYTDEQLNKLTDADVEYALGSDIISNKTEIKEFYERNGLEGIKNAVKFNSLNSGKYKTELEKSSPKTEKDIVLSFISKLKENENSMIKESAVDSVLIDAQQVLKSFNSEEKKIIGKWLMDSGADSPITLQKKLENEVKPKKIEQKREITRHRDDLLHTR